MILEMAGWGSKVVFGLARFVEARAAKTFIGMPVIFGEIKIMLNERSAGKTANGSIDMIWINGENFRTAKQAKVLWGPFAEALPNVRSYDPEVRKRDFGTAIEGYEAPWQKSQFVFAYDAARTPDPPRSLDSLRSWIKAHPGRFTYIAPPDYTGSAFIRHVLIHFGGGSREFRGGFRED